VSPAIAEHPGAQIRDVVALGMQLKRSAGALDCFGKPLPVVQCLAQAAIKPGSFVVGEIRTPETKAAFLNLAGSGCTYHHLTNFTSVAQPGGTLDAVGWPRFTCGRAGSGAGAGITHQHAWPDSPLVKNCSMTMRNFTPKASQILLVDLSKGRNVLDLF